MFGRTFRFSVKIWGENVSKFPFNKDDAVHLVCFVYSAWRTTSTKLSFSPESPFCPFRRSIMKSTLLVGLFLVATCLLAPTQAFVASKVTTTFPKSPTTTQRHSTPEDREQRLRNLGFSSDEIQKSGQDPVERVEEQKVRVDLVEDIDPFTLTAIGFAAIAFNFLVLGNLGDGGLGGLIATAINLLNQ